MPRPRSYHDHHPAITVEYSASTLSRWGFFPVILQYLRNGSNCPNGSGPSRSPPPPTPTSSPPTS